MRLIDADALMKELYITTMDCGKCFWGDKDDRCTRGLEEVCGAIEHAPTIEERKVGKWIHDGYNFPHGNDWIHCSVCGKRGINVPADKSNYCPDCGARMEN